MTNVKDELKKLEASVETLEKQFEKFDKELKEEFIEKILLQFDDLLEERANKLSYCLKNPIFEKSDIKQEFVLYILKYNYQEAKRRAILGGEVWIPYLKNSIRNCSINLIKKYGQDTKRNPKFELLDLDDPTTEKVFLISDFVDYDFLFSKIGYFILKKLNRVERLLFLSVVYPSVNFRKYLEKKKLKVSKITISRYFGIPYSLVVKSFKKIKSTFVDVVNCNNIIF
jgi:hypothetical protein